MTTNEKKFFRALFSKYQSQKEHSLGNSEPAFLAERGEKMRNILEVVLTVLTRSCGNQFNSFFIVHFTFFFEKFTFVFISLLYITYTPTDGRNRFPAFFNTFTQRLTAPHDALLTHRTKHRIACRRF